MHFSELSANQIRVAVDARQTYDAYREARNISRQYAFGLSWKLVKGREYLIKVFNRKGGNKSLGPRSPETEKIFAEFVAGKARAKEREAALAKSLGEFAGMSRGVGINRTPAVVTATLRKMDEFGLLGKNLMVIGTNAMYGYESSAGVMFDAGLLATTDVDFLWDARASLKLALFDGDVAESGVLAVLKKVDKSFERVSNSEFRAVNKTGFYVDLLMQAPDPPWKKDEPEKIASEDLSPSWLPNIKWLLSSEKFHSVVIGQDGLPAPMVSPDPRAFATYKIWLSQQPDREPAKQRRDRAQAIAVAELVRVKLPHLAFDENAERMFPRSVRVASKMSSFGL
jgi:hypothetical protein